MNDILATSIGGTEAGHPQHGGHFSQCEKSGMRSAVCRSFAGISLLTAVLVAHAATRPHYGGTLRIETRAKVMSIGPAEWPAGAEADALLAFHELIFDRLVRLDANGEPQPDLALSWEHDAQNKTWLFTLRPGVKWHDGAPLTAQEVESALAGAAPGMSVRVTKEGTLEIRMNEPRPDLLAVLATDPAWMIRRPSPVPSDALPIGTGPFRLTAWEAGRRAAFQANDSYWGGRPFVDSIEVQMGRSSREQLIDLELDKADVVEVDPVEARRAQQENRRIWTSAPLDLLAIAFDLNKAVVQDRRLREAIAGSIDRAAIQKVLLQNYGEATGSILPRWVSGYAFLFPATMDLNRARQLTAQIGTPPTLKLGYDASDPLSRQLAERVAVNARDAGITLEVSPLPAGWRHMPDTGTDLRVTRTRINAPSLDAAFRQAAASLEFPADAGAGSAERTYAAEQKVLDAFSVVPLVAAEEVIGLGPHVKDWSALPWGAWRIEDVWLEAAKP